MAQGLIRNSEDGLIRMGQLLVRNIEESVIDGLKLKAELNGHSLEQELRDILSAAAPLTPQQKIQMSRRVQAMTPKGVKQTPSEDIIREDRDNR